MLVVYEIGIGVAAAFVEGLGINIPIKVKHPTAMLTVSPKNPAMSFIG
jgi:hypothetical protein